MGKSCLAFDLFHMNQDTASEVIRVSVSTDTANGCVALSVRRYNNQVADIKDTHKLCSLNDIVIFLNNKCVPCAEFTYFHHHSFCKEVLH